MTVFLDTSLANGGMSTTKEVGMKGKPPKGKPADTEPTPATGADELPERWSVQRKTERMPFQIVQFRILSPPTGGLEGEPDEVRAEDDERQNTVNLRKVASAANFLGFVVATMSCISAVPVPFCHRRAERSR